MEIGYNCLNANGEFIRGIYTDYESIEEVKSKLHKEGCTGIDVWIMKGKARKERKRTLKLYKVAIEAPTKERFIDEYWAYSKAEAKEEIESNGFKVWVIAAKDKFHQELEEFNMKNTN